MGTSANDIFQLAPHDTLPAGRHVVCLEGEGDIRYVIDEEAPLHLVIAEINSIAGHLVHNGIWQQRQGGGAPPPPRMRHVS